MALRVLLADESVTIKKVFQLSLQDFGVEVVTVSSGLDVIPVAKKSNFDIVFADVILPKKSGYDVCKEIRQDASLKNIPVVLIWSGFMELDQQKFKACGASDHLEKPFDTAQLRSIVQKLVTKTKTQQIGSYLSFPRLPDFDETETKSQVLNLNPNTTTQTSGMAPTLSLASKEETETPESWSMESFEPMRVPTGETSISHELDLNETPDEFVPVDIPTAPPPSKAAALRSKVDIEVAADDTPEENENQWVQKTLSKYKLKEPLPEEASDVHYEDPIDPDTIVRNQMPSQPPPIDMSSEKEDEIELDLAEPTSPRQEPLPQLNEKQLEAIIRAQSKDVIEKVVWQVVPEIAAQIIEREIQKLIKERHDVGPR